VSPTPFVLLFDLDGTLTDPQLETLRCMRYALDKLGVACPFTEVLASYIGPSLRGTFDDPTLWRGVSPWLPEAGSATFAN
jgi:phosphoglycolate phosphatase-like HAD superfamily hydrolase